MKDDDEDIFDDDEFSIVEDAIAKIIIAKCYVHPDQCYSHLLSRFFYEYGRDQLGSEINIS